MCAFIFAGVLVSAYASAATAPPIRLRRRLQQIPQPACGEQGLGCTCACPSGCWGNCDCLVGSPTGCGGPSPTPSQPTPTPPSSSTGWTIGEAGASCNTACRSSFCSASGTLAVTSGDKFESVLSSIGYTCSAFSSGTDNEFPAFYNGVCYGRSDYVFDNCAEFYSSSRRLCCCGGAQLPALGARRGPPQRTHLHAARAEGVALKKYTRAHVAHSSVLLSARHQGVRTHPTAPQLFRPR